MLAQAIYGMMVPQIEYRLVSVLVPVHSGYAGVMASVDEYLAAVPTAAKERFDELRGIVRGVLPDAREVISYGILGYRMNPKRRAVVYIGAFRDHVSIYPIPHDPDLAERIAPYQRGRGTLWFPLDQPLDEALTRAIVSALAQA